VAVKERQRHSQRQCQLAVTEADERAMAAWHESFPHDVVDEHEFRMQKRAERNSISSSILMTRCFVLDYHILICCTV
jgi:hypothetical protein